MNLNYKNIGTYSQAIKKVIAIKKTIIDIIDSIPEVKRLCRYNDRNPLGDAGIGYDDERIIHSELTTTLTKDTDEGKKVIYSGIFNEETISELQNLIFVTPKVLNIGLPLNEYLFEIDILVNQQYNELFAYYEERIYSIADYICDRLDDYTVDDPDVVDLVGNIKFQLIGKIIPCRLTSNSTHILLPIPVVVKSVGLRD